MVNFLLERSKMLKDTAATEWEELGSLVHYVEETLSALWNLAG